jgi:hypothetical protein
VKELIQKFTVIQIAQIYSTRLDDHYFMLHVWPTSCINLGIIKFWKTPHFNSNLDSYPHYHQQIKQSKKLFLANSRINGRSEFFTWLTFNQCVTDCSRCDDEYRLRKNIDNKEDWFRIFALSSIFTQISIFYRMHRLDKFQFYLKLSNIQNC